MAEERNVVNRRLRNALLLKSAHLQTSEEYQNWFKPQFAALAETNILFQLPKSMDKKKTAWHMTSSTPSSASSRTTFPPLRQYGLRMPTAMQRSRMSSPNQSPMSMALILEELAEEKKKSYLQQFDNIIQLYQTPRHIQQQLVVPALTMRQRQHGHHWQISTQSQTGSPKNGVILQAAYQLDMMKHILGREFRKDNVRKNKPKVRRRCTMMHCGKQAVSRGFCRCHGGTEIQEEL